jgi:hypothetical protein
VYRPIPALFYQNTDPLRKSPSRAILVQLFLNSKTSRPVDFSYGTAHYRGMQIGVIRIPVQERPTYSKKTYGIVQSDVVYLRRGSSTARARPDEIAQMALAQADRDQSRPDLSPLIASGVDWSTLNTTVAFETIYLAHPNIQSLPDYAPPRSADSFGVISATLAKWPNADFYRQQAHYLRSREMLRPIRFAVRNSGKSVASNVKVVFDFRDEVHACKFVLGDDFPGVPQREHNFADRFPQLLAGRKASDIAVTKKTHGWEIVATLDRIQAKDTKLTSDQLFIGLAASQTVALTARIFADELTDPVTAGLSLNFTVTTKEIPIKGTGISIKDLKRSDTTIPKTL